MPCDLELPTIRPIALPNALRRINVTNVTSMGGQSFVRVGCGEGWLGVVLDTEKVDFRTSHARALL